MLKSFIISVFNSIKPFGFYLAIIISFCSVTVYAQDEFDIVESNPVETVLEKSALSKTYDVWLRMIKDSKESIDIETFYFADEKDQPLQNILNELINASARGVRVRIIVDSGFYANNDKSVDKLNGIENIYIKKIPFSNIAGGVMHAKYFIVDNETVFLGSQNFDWRALIHIHEIGARIKNKNLAKTFSELFAFDWELCDGVFSNQIYGNIVNKDNTVILKTEKYGEIILYPAFSPSKFNLSGMNSEEEELLSIIGNTQNRLLIQIYSYSLKAKNENNYYNKIDSALRAAAGRGVEINMILPDWAIRESSIDFIKELSTVKNIKIKFITIPQYSEGFIPYARVDHTKYFVSDNNKSWISTSNWEWSYFYNSRNVSLVIENEKINMDLQKTFYKSWESPYTEFVDVDKIYQPVKRN